MAISWIHISETSQEALAREVITISVVSVLFCFVLFHIVYTNKLKEVGEIEGNQNKLKYFKFKNPKKSNARQKVVKHIISQTLSEA